MQWADEGVVLSVRPHGETGAVAEVFTRAHGRYLGLVHGGRGRTKRPILQPGNHVTAEWRARISEQLGVLTLELKHPFAAELLDRRLGLAGLECLTTLARLLPERDPHANLFEVTLFVLGFLGDDEIWPALYARWELALLQELGFGLDLSACAVTGANDYLAYVSPRTGRAVSAAASQERLGFGCVLPIVLRHVHRDRQRAGHLDQHGFVGSAVFQQQHRVRAVLGQAVGQHAPGGAGADDDVVENRV